MRSLLVSFLLSASGVSASALHQPRGNASGAPEQTSDAPIVELTSGAYYGLHKPAYDQDEFLGIPYAQPPLGDLRLSPPQPLNDSWDSPRNATEYSPLCFGYGSDTWVLGNHVSEDCLTLNVIRPHGVSADSQLPVAVWIYGGGLRQGGSADPRYNLTFIVEQSVKMGTPIVAASVNYRMAGWGFLWSDEVKKAGVGNLGFRDQRLALEWIHENIGAFGGDPGKVTIWGESAGARSAATQLIAYGGRDDGLFRAAILESGTGLDFLFHETEEDEDAKDQEYYDNVVEQAGCADADDSLQCLRELDAWTLSDIFNATEQPVIGHKVDGVFVTEPRHETVKSGNAVPVPVLIGTNFDEGAQYAREGVNTTEDWVDFLVSEGANNDTVGIVSALYPDIPRVGLPATLKGRPSGDKAFYGEQWKRAVAYAGDKQQHAAKRWWARQWADRNLTAYSYHFNVLVNGMDDEQGASHFQEVAFVFNNVEGLGYDTVVNENPFEGKPETFNHLADVMSRMWVSFITTTDPNNDASPVDWPAYSVEEPQNVVFDVNASSLAYLEDDTYRTEQIEYFINKFWETEEK